MPMFSKRSLEKLGSAHVDLQTLFKEVVKYFDCTVVEGFRNEADQNKAYEAGNSKLKWPNGNHNKNPSLAGDVFPYPLNLSPKNAKEATIYKFRMCYFAGQVKAMARILLTQGKISHDVIWGCDWDNDTEIADHEFLDFCHFELK